MKRSIGNLELSDEPSGNMILSYRGASHLTICIQRADLGDVEAALRAHRRACELDEGRPADSLRYERIRTPQGVEYHTYSFKSAGGHYSYRALIPVMIDQWPKFEKLTKDTLGGDAWVPCADWEVLLPFLSHYATCQAGVKY